MLSNQILQNTIDGLKGITRRDICVVDRDGKVVASTDYHMSETKDESLSAFIASQAETQSLLGNNYIKVFENGIAEYVVIIKGDDDESYRVGKITAFHLQSLIIAYKERFDKDNFIKNLLLDNLLLVDIYSRAKKLRIDNNARRIVYLIETDNENEINPVEVIRNIFPSKGRDFVTVVDDENIILVKEIHDRDNNTDIEKQALAIRDTLCSEMMSKVFVAMGTPVSDLKNVSNSYKEAKMALEVRRIFEPEKSIINYDKLGIGRIIYQLPLPLCRMFVGEVLHGQTVEQFDEETLSTIEMFFECSLNISETSRQLYIHRNTLVYRLDRIQKITGLDLRTFDDAILFKITMMVSRYLDYTEKHGY